jgi:hypothetical protein
MHGFLGSGLGGRDLYAPTTGIFSFGPNRENNKDFAEDGSLLEKVSLWPETVFARMVRHFQRLCNLDWVRGIRCRWRTVNAIIMRIKT